MGSVPGLGRSPGGGHGNPVRYPSLENSKDRGAWQATVHGVAKSQTRLSTHEGHNLFLMKSMVASNNLYFLRN